MNDTELCSLSFPSNIADTCSVQSPSSKPIAAISEMRSNVAASTFSICAGSTTVP